ncbi:uncharacterized protein LOC126854233 isoform X2 [Cataglyphis hispanica]|nr:uncharacterized protein LOC126854233 isoform X2 [Cataglyphis hispanica]XP_050456714.1 uncharacterized protein LOC126854233 isoform X2 [Cataglyphis hispanica]
MHSSFKTIVMTIITRFRNGVLDVIKSARARSTNAEDRRAMFYLDGRGNAAAKYDSSSSSNEEEENFGWWLNDREIAVLQRGKDHRSSGPMTSCCADSADNRSFAKDVSRQEQESEISSEKIELSSFTRDDLIENDAKEANTWSMTEDDNQDNMREEFKAICYTPERLIRSQEYRILVPSSRHFIFSQARLKPENESRERKSRHCRKQLDCLIDSKQIGATQLRKLLNLSVTDVRTHSSTFEREPRIKDDFNASVRSDDDHPADRDRSEQSTGTISSSRSSYDRLNSIGDNKDLISRPLSLEDTSGIQSNDWSLETQSDSRSTHPMCLCDELAIASRDCIGTFRNHRDIAINEVTSILENLQSDAEEARILLEEDSFCDGTTSHDRLTRLALAIETDAEVPPTVSDSNNWICHLRDKIERLQLGNKEIHKNIYGLHTNFQCDEKKAVDLSCDTRKLIEDIHELRYFDDLLKLLEGELERISSRNWPFVLGHSQSREEMNLII